MATEKNNVYIYIYVCISIYIYIYMQCAQTGKELLSQLLLGRLGNHTRPTPTSDPRVALHFLGVAEPPTGGSVFPRNCTAARWSEVEVGLVWLPMRPNMQPLAAITPFTHTDERTAAPAVVPPREPHLTHPYPQPQVALHS
jgi:hypothetical protein